MRPLQPAVEAKGWSAGRTRPDRYQARPAAEIHEKPALAWPVKAFLVSLVIPWIFSVGDLSFSAYRIVLIFAFVVCLANWARGKAGPLRVADFGLMAFCCWVAVTLVVAHGVGFAVEPSGIWLIETMGAYLLARCYIRNAADFRNMVAMFVKLIICLFPFAVYEWVTGKNLLLAIFGVILPTYDVVTMPQRMGFWRVQGPFLHPILFGIFCSTMLALTWLVHDRGRSAAGRLFLTATVAVTAFFSMSSAPVAALAVQIALIAWNKILLPLSARWKLLWALLAAMYLVIEIGSSHTPIQFYITHFTFDKQTGWYRLLIWEFGSASVLNHPLFGIGLGDWARPEWMGGDSVDNFWLLMAMRHGLPGFGLLAGSCLAIWIAIARRRGLDAETDRYRTAYLICMTSYVFAGSTVHLWGSSYVTFIFLIGAGVWLLDAKAQQVVPAGEPRSHRQYNRKPLDPENRARPVAPPRARRATAIRRSGSPRR